MVSLKEHKVCQLFFNCVNNSYIQTRTSVLQLLCEIHRFNLRESNWFFFECTMNHWWWHILTMLYYTFAAIVSNIEIAKQIQQASIRWIIYITGGLNYHFSDMCTGLTKPWTLIQSKCTDITDFKCLSFLQYSNLHFVCNAVKSSHIAWPFLM
jgi:hypothetical protein